VSATRNASLIPHWYGGAAHEHDGPTGQVHDPARGVAVREVAFADAAVVGAAVAAARTASETWGEEPAARRAALLAQWARVLREHRAELVELVCEENGKIPLDAEGEFERGIEVLDLAAGGGPLLLKGEFSDQVARGVDVRSMRRPLGVTAAITPFNFPLMAPIWLSSISLVCGNAVVIKPSEQDPGTAVRLAELAREAGLPDGVYNVVHGDKVAVDALLDHADVAAITFVGSTPVARYVYERGTAAGKRVQAFGSAKNHMVALPDCNLDFAADAAVSAAYGASGQRCMAVAALVAVGEVADPLVAAIAERARALRIGGFQDEGSELGPLVSRAACERVVGHIAGAEAAGAELVLDGRAYEHPQHRDGFYVGPTLVDRVTPQMDVYTQEVFGPLLPVLRVETLDAAIELLNASPYGNGAAIFTASGGAARRFEREAQAGMIGVNVPIPIPVAQYSFGGWKASRFGDVHMSGPEGYRFYTKGKIVTTRWPETSSGVNLAFGGAGR